MRIAVFDDLPEGGAKRVVFEHVKGLSAEHQVFYFTNEIPTRFPFEKYAHDIETFPFTLWPLKGALRPFQEASYSLTYQKSYQLIGQRCRELHIDLLLMHPSRLTQCPELVHYVNIPVVYFAEEWLRLVYEPEKHPLPMGITGVYEQTRRRWIQQLDYHAVQAVTHIVTTSQYNQARINWAYHRDADKIALGVNTQTFFPQSHQRQYYLFIGERHPLNGFDLLPQRSPLAIKFISFGKQGSFKYSDRELRTLYTNAYATLCFGRNEPFGLIPLESMACETPVIALAEGGYTETVVAGKTGWLIPPCKLQIEKLMLNLIDQPKTIEAYAKSGPAHVHSKFTWEQHILQLEKTLHKVMYDSN